MTKRFLKDLAYTASRDSSLSRAQAEKAVGPIVAAMRKTLQRGDTLCLYGLGTFTPKPTGQGRPFGGKPVVSVRFRPSEGLRQELRRHFHGKRNRESREAAASGN